MIAFKSILFPLFLTFFNFQEESLVSGSETYLTNNGFPINFLDSIVSSSVVQRKLKSRWKWEVWDVVPGTHTYQLYIFNITNPFDVERGQKPILKQLGPYFYNEHRYKFNVSVNLDLTVNFERNYTYSFDHDKSIGSESDLVNIINLPLIIFSTIAAAKDPVVANSAVKTLNLGGESLVKRQVKVGDLLYHGIDISNYIPYAKLLGPDNDLVDEFLSGRYGILKLKEGTHEKPFVVNSGLLDDSKMGQIVSWNGQPQLNWWPGKSCNMINGTDGSSFPPHLSKYNNLQMFDLDLCRSIYFEYAHDMMFHGAVQGMQFNIGKDVLADPHDYPANECFCKTANSCLNAGLLDVSNCRNGAPFVMSYAHFLDANPDLLQKISGLTPDRNLHQTRIAVEPVTGSVINLQKRYQFNVLLKPVPHIDYFRNINPIVFPILWNDDAFHLSPDKAQLLVEELAAQSGGSGDGSSIGVKITDCSLLSTFLTLMFFAVCKIIF